MARPRLLGNPDRKISTFALYVGGVIIAGGAALAAEVSVLMGPRPLGPFPLAFFVFAACLLLAEVRPMNWLSLQDGGEVTASWTFALAMIYLAPPAAPLFAMAAVCLVADLVRRKPLVRALFNAAQVTLSLALAAAVFGFICEVAGMTSEGRLGLLWLLATLAAAAVAFLANSLFTCVVLALHQRMPIWPVIRTSIGVNLAMDGLLLALAPVFALVAVHDIWIIPLLLVTVWVIVHSAVLALQNRHEATHDLLTGIPNRRYFTDQATMSITGANSGESMALVQLDLNGFKAINDRLGHHYGDLVLREVAARLSADKRSTDLFARLGGDEFAFLLRRVDSDDGALDAVSRYHEALLPQMTIDGVPVSINGSFGVALYPEDGEDLDTLLHNADMAMYRAKASGGGVARYQSEGGSLRPVRVALVSELARAMEREELFLVYQPRVAAASGQVLGVEALLRWQHPTRGLVGPGDFMPFVEQTELIDPITEYVAQRAIEQCARWHAAGVHVSVAINVSARNLHDLHFPQTLAKWLRAANLDPGWIELEITENAVMADPVRSASVLGHLRSLGVCSSIDDFGTGYSSLSKLRMLTIDWLKIDRSFITGMLERAEDITIVRSIIDLAHNLGLRTVAEGVEQVEELELLAAMGCEAVQGFLLARPALPEELEGVLRAGRFDLAALARWDGVTTPAAPVAVALPVGEVVAS